MLIPRRPVLAILALAVIALYTVLVLTACGGAEPEDDDSKTTPQPPDCTAQPSPCK